MKLATFLASGGAHRIAAVDPDRDRALDLQEASRTALGLETSAFSSMLAFIESGESTLVIAQSLVDEWPTDAGRTLSSLKLLSPLPRPNSMRDCMVFEQHLIDAGRRLAHLAGREPTPIPQLWYERPTYYKGNRMSVVGAEADVIWPRYCKQMDFELEMACVVGRVGKDISREHALDHIFGFTIFNDFSARDAQAKERVFGQGPTKAKDFDTGNVLGPWIVTRDEIGDPQNLAMEVRVNGDRWGGGNSSGMYHPFAAIISFISIEETLYPGDVIGSGTVGTGCGLELGRFLKPGDVVELEIEKIGVLRNRIVKLF